MARFCTNCGAPLEADAKFCASCGTPADSGVAAGAVNSNRTKAVPGTSANIPVFENSPVSVLLLGIITCGLYLIYWNIKAAEVLNAVTGQNLISPTVASISGCCFPVNVYFYYLCGQALSELGKTIGRESLTDKSTLLVILGFFIPVVSAMIVQGHINEIYMRR